jgi:hypothetical protein
MVHRGMLRLEGDWPQPVVEEAMINEYVSRCSLDCSRWLKISVGVRAGQLAVQLDLQRAVQQKRGQSPSTNGTGIQAVHFKRRVCDEGLGIGEIKRTVHQERVDGGWRETQMAVCMHELGRGRLGTGDLCVTPLTSCTRRWAPGVVHSPRWLQ